MTGSWLCRDDLHRERLLDMERHLRPVRALTMLLILVVSTASLGFVDLRTLAVAAVGVVVAAGLFRMADALAIRVERPEYVMFGAWTGAEVVIALCIVLTGGPESPGVAWLAIPVVTLSSRFSIRGVLLGLGIALTLLLAATVGVDPGAVADDTTKVIAPAILVFSVAILSIALMRSDVEHRGAAVIDQLTGMLNRKALLNRAEELSQQSGVTGQPVSLIVADLDHFKTVNDSRGHAAGDAVLKDLAYAMRKRLRAFDLCYRIGGEEFLVLLPGAELGEARRVAEDLRSLLEGKTLGDGVSITMSFGVAGSTAGERFDYERTFASADLALYEAKRRGRNRVCVSAGTPVLQSSPPPVAATA